MSTYLSVKRVATAGRLHAIARHGSATDRARVFLRKTQLGAWVVGEGNGRRGGIFFTQEAALKFIRSEFGADAQIVAADTVRKTAA